MTIDYKLLLEKYVRYIGECEGVDFVSGINDRDISKVEFSAEEEAEMIAVSDRVSLSRSA